MSHSDTHARRLSKLIERVKTYADAEGIKHTTASFAVFADGKELERLEGTGSTKPLTLEKYEYVIRRLETDRKQGVTGNRRARAKAYGAEFRGQLQPVSA